MDTDSSQNTAIFQIPLWPTSVAFLHMMYLWAGGGMQPSMSALFSLGISLYQGFSGVIGLHPDAADQCLS